MTRKKKSSAKNGEEDRELFAEETPLDEYGLPLASAEIPADEASHAPLDPESSRRAAEYRHVAMRKSAGAKSIPFNAPDPEKYNLAVELHPEAHVRIYQTEPEPDHSIPEKTLFRDYELLRAHVAELWNGERAVYKWEVHSGRHSWATGTIKFRENDMKRHGGPYPQPQGYYPPQQQQMPPPYGQAPLPYQPPQQVFVQSPPQQPPAPPPIQLPPGADPTSAAVLAVLQDLMRQNAELRAQLQYGQYAPQQPVSQPLPQPAPPPPQPKTLTDQLSEMSSVIRTVNDFRSNMERQFEGGGGEAETTPPPLNDEGFPIKFKDIGPLRMVADQDGNVSAPFLANIDKYEGLFDGVVDKLVKGFKRLGEERNKQIREQVEIMERAEGVANRTALLRGQAPQQVAPPPQQPRTVFGGAAAMGAASAPSSREPVKPREPEHPWDKFVGPPVEPPAPAEPEVVEATGEVAD